MYFQYKNWQSRSRCIFSMYLVNLLGEFVVIGLDEVNTTKTLFLEEGYAIVAITTSSYPLVDIQQEKIKIPPNSTIHWRVIFFFITSVDCDSLPFHPPA